ncbi:hypothetical protein [Frateuria sp. Soil773]|uniref:hypothetical protein n=1 Tax=Frateuria sp. Soil773 TaxID=1736407 RepID=UPI001F4202B0|nr:hypothetical protein [Frateuria sp. Soil773]
MVNYVEDCLDRFMYKLPPAYRNRPLPEQPDIVWGQRVLPNFLNTQQGLWNAYIKLTHGDYEMLNAAHRVSNDVRGQREFSYTWLDEVEEGGGERYWKLLLAAGDYAGNIIPTAGGSWPKTILTSNFSSERGELDPPTAWPLYRINPSVQVKTGDVASQSGVYLPEIEDACANFLIGGQTVTRARVGYGPETLQYISKQPTLWTLIERVPGETVPLAEGLGKIASTPLHVVAGKSCPRAGWWLTPAKAHSRRHFKQGDVFPVIEDSAYGDTYWQWSPDQSSPSL